jgi:signal transduction histidine kinase
MLSRNKNQAPVTQNIRIRLTLGALIACLMIATIGIINWYALENVNQQVRYLVNESAVKTGLIYDMRTTARERNLHLAMSLLVTDPFLIDQQWSKVKEQGTLFLIAREKFKNQNLSTSEIALLNRQREISKHAVKLQYLLHQQHLSGEYKKATNTFTREISMQVKVFSVLDDILEIHKKNSQIIINNIFESQRKTLKTIIILIIFIFSIIYLISSYLLKHLSIQAQEIKNEGIKYKALIEGSTDGILVLDKNQVIDCNNSALKLFEVESLTELNKIGLDYFSQFSDSKTETKTDGIFGAINFSLINHKTQYEWKFKNSKNIDFPADIELKKIDIDKKNYIQIIIRDISERKNAEQALIDANKNLEKKIRERTNELNTTNTKMIGLARSAGMSEVASGVLHNVGNVLNSVNVSASVLKTKAASSKINNIEKIANILKENSDDINNYLKNDEAGKLLIPYIEQLSLKLNDEQKEQEQEIDCLIHNIDHIKNIISMQQSYTSNAGITEKVMTSEVANDAININISSINKKNINLSKYYDIDFELSVDKHKLIQILVNLISNANHAVITGGKTDKDIIIGIKKDNENIIFYVEDNGIGIEKEDLERVFEFGFKKRVGGHGYGLHHSALVAKELGGNLIVESDGLNQGARFTLTIPGTQSS